MNSSLSSKPSRIRKTPAKNLTAALESAIKNLPSQEEKLATKQACTEIAAFFTEMEKQLTNLPSKEEGEKILLLIQNLERTLSSKNSSLGSVLGLSAGRRKPGGASRLSPERAELLGIDELQKLTAVELERKLSDEEKHPLSQIRQIALELGVSDVARTPRSSLVQQITKKIENFRGYQRLRDSGS